MVGFAHTLAWVWKHSKSNSAEQLHYFKRKDHYAKIKTEKGGFSELKNPGSRQDSPSCNQALSGASSSNSRKLKEKL